MAACFLPFGMQPGLQSSCQIRASDCYCNSHLYFFLHRPARTAFIWLIEPTKPRALQGEQPTLLALRSAAPYFLLRVSCLAMTLSLILLYVACGITFFRTRSVLALYGRLSMIFCE